MGRKGVTTMTKRRGEIIPYDSFGFGLFSRDIFDFAPFHWPIWVRWPDFGELRSQMEVTEKDGQIVVEAPMAGIPLENIAVSYEKDGMLRIEGVLKKEEGGRSITKRVAYTTLLRSMIDTDSAEATVKDGMLRIEAKATGRIGATKIPVKAVEKK